MKPFPIRGMPRSRGGGAKREAFNNEDAIKAYRAVVR
jgi:hypothetical protein